MDRTLNLSLGNLLPLSYVLMCRIKLDRHMALESLRTKPEYRHCLPRFA